MVYELRARCQGRASARSIRLPPNLKEFVMLTWTLIFLVVSLIAGALGFGGASNAAAGIAKVLFLIFIVGFVVSLILGATNGFHW